MASIRENKKNGKTVSYHFTVCLDRDIRGKQIRKAISKSQLWFDGELDS